MDRSLLARATDSSEGPTPGYLYVDLAKQAGGNPAVCADMARYLTNRLSTKQNVYVKTKCCKVLAKLCEQVPRNAFRRVLAQDAQAVSCIKQALQHRGPLDPLQGDTKNEAVRAAAREALDAVYAEAPAESHHMPSGGMSGYGGGGGVSSSYGAPPHANGGGGGGSRMQGIGNPMFADPRLQPQSHGGGGKLPPNVQAAVKEAGEVVMGMIRDPLARNIGNPSQQHHHHNPNVPSQGHSGDLPGYNRSYGRPPPGATELSRKTNGEWTMASNRGPGAYNNNSYYQQRAAAHAQQPGGTSVSSGGVGGSWANASVPTGGVASAAREPAYRTPSITITPGRTPATSGASSDGSYEKNLITELCPPGGLKAVPPADKLQDFIRAVPTLNADWICPVLLDALEDGQPWIIRAKALCVMEAAIAHGQGADGSHPYRDFFYACAEEIAPLAHHNRAAIAEPARRVLQLLGVEGGGSGGGGGAPVSAPPVAAAPNLLDFGDDNAAPIAAPPASAPPPPPAPAAPSTGGGSSMFGGMQVKSKAVAPAAPTPAPVAAAPAPDLFDFGASAPAPAAPATAADPFESTASAHSTESAPSSMFANLQVKDDAASTSSAPAPETPAPAPAAGGSAFGFINKTSEEKKTSTSPAAPPSFDPLLALGGNGAAATQAHQNKMQMSPEQMQALAYQQMMMQQQMQQMQMAMMRGTAPPMPPVFRQGSGGVAPGGPPMTPQQMQQMMMMQQQQRQSMTMQNAKAAKKDDKKFDFVKDAMFSEKKH